MSTATKGGDRYARVLELCSETLDGRRLIIVSNRGPVEHRLNPDGQIQVRRGSGGLVTAFSSLMRDVDLTWVSSAMGEGDRRVWDESQGNSIQPAMPGSRASIRYVNTPRRVYHKFYNTLCNPLLWFLQHYMWSPSYTPTIDGTMHDAWENGYVPVNRLFAEAVVAEGKAAGGSVCVMVHDYHLYLVAQQVREALPSALIEHFVHIPWPSPEYWELMPGYIRTSICRSLCASDIVGFQTQRDGHNFIQSCQEFLPGAEVDYAACTVTLEGRQTLVRSYPLSINVEEVRRIAASSRTQEYERQLQSARLENMIVRVDRAEPSKNILRGFKAYEELLKQHPELLGKVNFLAFLVPSRTHIRQFQRYLEEIEQLAESINGACGTPEWQPIQLFMENNYTQAVAGLKLYDVLLVNAVIDGMSLVAKEGPVINENNGVLLLSGATGAYPQLANGVLPVATADVQGTMEAMYQAITMSNEERERRSAILTESIEREDITNWFQRQFEDINALVK